MIDGTNRYPGQIDSDSVQMSGMERPRARLCCTAAKSSPGLNSSLNDASYNTLRKPLQTALAAVLAQRSRGLLRRARRGSETLRRELEESQEVREEVFKSLANPRFKIERINLRVVLNLPHYGRFCCSVNAI